MEYAGSHVLPRVGDAGARTCCSRLTCPTWYYCLSWTSTPISSALRPLGGFFVLRTAGAPADPPPTLAQAYAHRGEDVYADSANFSCPYGRGPCSQLRAAGFRVDRAAGARGPAVVRRPRLRRPVRQRPRPRPPAAPLGPRRAAPPTTCGWRRCAPGRPTRRRSWTSSSRRPPGAPRGRPARPATASPRACCGATRAPRSPARPASSTAGRARTAGRRRTPVRAPTPSPPNCSPTRASPRPAPCTGSAFRRRSCCLYYRVPGGGLCGDCCFDREHRPRRPQVFPERLIWVTMWEPTAETGSFGCVWAC